MRARAVRMVMEHQGGHASQWAAIRSIATKISCSGEALRGWVRQAARDRGLREGMTSETRERLKALERENRELRRANEILRKASAYFAMIEGNAALLRALPEMLDRRSELPPISLDTALSERRSRWTSRGTPG